MKFGLREHDISAVVLDIEGTTTPMVFVYEVLFPYARTHLRESLDTLDGDALREPMRMLRAEWLMDVAQGDQPPGRGLTTNDQRLTTNDQVAAYAEWLMDRDRKSPGLKRLQGQIWEAGYRSGALTGEVFADVPAAFVRWRRLPVGIAIYSSGSRLAQQLLFSHTAYGDLTSSISQYFDTDVGPKTSPESYRRIAEALGVATRHVLFVSDAAAELSAAAAVECHVLMSQRPGNRAQPVHEFLVIGTFDEVV